MSYTAAQQAAVASNVAAVRGNVGKHAQDFFVFWLKNSPGEISKFPNYKGKTADTLSSVSQFAKHSKDVVEDLLAFVEIAHDSGALKAKAANHMKTHASRNLSGSDYDSLFASLIPFLEKTLGGGCATDGWQNATALVGDAIKAQM